MFAAEFVEDPYPQTLRKVVMPWRAAEERAEHTRLSVVAESGRLRRR